jgi:hypothetical protein
MDEVMHPCNFIKENLAEENTLRGDHPCVYDVFSETKYTFSLSRDLVAYMWQLHMFVEEA